MADQVSRENTTYKNRQAMQHEALRLATDHGWRTIKAKGDTLVIRR